MSGGAGTALVILAAGESVRLGRCKALVPITPQNPLELLCSAGACLIGPPPLVVTGADHDEIAARAPPGVEIVFNPNWRRGRSGGVLLASLRRPGCDLCLSPVDVPLAPASVFQALLSAWLAADHPSRGWLAPWVPTPGAVGPGTAMGEVTAVGDGRAFGHPVIVGRELLVDLAAVGPDTPLSALRRLAEPLISVEVASRAILDDLDTPQDLERLRAHSRG